MRILAAAWRQGSLPLNEVASRGFGSTASGRQIAPAGSPRRPSRTISTCRGGRSIASPALRWTGC